MTRERCFWLGLAVLVVTGVLLIYGRVLHLGWAHHDDLSILTNVEENPWYLPGKAAGLPPVVWSPAGVFRPMQFLPFKVSSMLWGRNPLPLHLFSLLLHAANALLLSWLLWRLTGNYGVAVASSLLFVARVNGQAVGWIGANADAICLFFLLLCVHSLVLVWRGRLAFLVPALLCFLLALASKEPPVVLPVLVTVGVFFGSRLTRSRKVLVCGLFWLCLVGFWLLRSHLGARLTGQPSWYWRHPTGTARFYFDYLVPHLYMFFCLWWRMPLSAFKYYFLGPVCALTSVGLLLAGVLTQGLNWQPLLKRTGYLLFALVLGVVCYLYLFQLGSRVYLPLHFWVSVAFLVLALTGRWRGLGWLAAGWAVLFAMPVAPFFFLSHGASRFFYLPDVGKVALAALVSQRYGGYWRWVVPAVFAGYVFSHSYGLLAGVLEIFYGR